MAQLYTRNRFVVWSQFVDLRKQHGHPQASLRRDLRVQCRADDNLQDQGSQSPDRRSTTTTPSPRSSLIPRFFFRQCQEFSEVFNLCVEVLATAEKASLVKATLEAMLRFLNWIPLGYIFETTVIDHLVERVSSSLSLHSIHLLMHALCSSSINPNSVTLL